MSTSESPLLTPRIAEALRDSGDLLVAEVRARILHSPRPVFLYYIAQTFDALDTALAAGELPRPATPAQQLCLHLMLECTAKYRDAVDHDIARIRAALLPDGTHEALIAIGRGAATGGDHYDFVALGDALSARGMSAFFAPLEPDSLAA